MSEKDGGPAFPQISTEIGQQYEPHISSSGGISKLEWFAGMALPDSLAEYHKHAADYGYDENWRAGVSRDAFQIAEAMLAESKRRKS